MRDVKKVLELRFKKASQRKIASTLSLSRNTVSQIIKSADEKMLFWDKASNMSETEIQDALFPRPEITLHLEKPDFEYIFPAYILVALDSVSRNGSHLRIEWLSVAYKMALNKRNIQDYSQDSTNDADERSNSVT